MSHTDLLEAVKRFCRTEEAANNLVAFIEARETAAREKQTLNTYIAWCNLDSYEAFGDWLFKQQTSPLTTKQEQPNE